MSIEHPALRPATRNEIMNAMMHGLVYGRDGKRTRHNNDFFAKVGAEVLIDHLERSGFVLMKKPAPMRGPTFGGLDPSIHE